MLAKEDEQWYPLWEFIVAREQPTPAIIIVKTVYLQIQNNCKSIFNAKIASLNPRLPSSKQRPVPNIETDI